MYRYSLNTSACFLPSCWLFGLHFNTLDRAPVGELQRMLLIQLLTQQSNRNVCRALPWDVERGSNGTKESENTARRRWWQILLVHHLRISHHRTLCVSAFVFVALVCRMFASHLPRIGKWQVLMKFLASFIRFFPTALLGSPANQAQN